MGREGYQPLLQDDDGCIDDDIKTSPNNYAHFNPAFCDIVEEKEIDHVEAVFVAAFDTHYGTSRAIYSLLLFYISYN